MPDYQPDEEQYIDIWVAVFTGPHRDHGGWWTDPGGQPVCACGEPVLAAPEGKAA